MTKIKPIDGLTLEQVGLIIQYLELIKGFGLVAKDTSDINQVIAILRKAEVDDL